MRIPLNSKRNCIAYVMVAFSVGQYFVLYNITGTVMYFHGLERAPVRGKSSIARLKQLVTICGNNMNC
jgi:hypothetical protein